MSEVEPPFQTRAECDEKHIAPVPRISLQAFCQSNDVATLINDAAQDRRMDRAHIKVHMGGAVAAIEAYRNAPTPNVIVIEAGQDRSILHGQLSELAEFCDSGTKVVIIGKINDITLFRELLNRGVSEYLMLPLTILDFVRSISALYGDEGAPPVGRIFAFVGAKGGVGSSCISHNVAWSIARHMETPTVIVDMDLGFGTVGLDFNQDPPQGLADAIFQPERLDANMLDRLLSKCSEYLSILAASATLDRVYDFPAEGFDTVCDILRTSVPCIILDMPHVWTAWSKRILTMSDEVVVVAAPDLANLRNTKTILDVLRSVRPNDHKPRLILNQMGILKRPEIDIADFAKAVEAEPIAAIPFDAKLFGTAANNGQMIAEIDPAGKTSELLREVSQILLGRQEVKRQKKNMFEPFVSRFLKLKAS